jgi:6-phosphogluconolactonase
MRSFKRCSSFFALLVAPLLLLAACGGGSGNGTGDSSGGGAAPSADTTPSSPSATTTPPPAAGTARAYAYVADDFARTVTGYSLDPTTGEMTELGSVDARGLPNRITVHPRGDFVYVSNSQDDGISAFRVDPATGGLSLIGVTAPSGSPNAHVAIDPTGAVLFLPINHAGDAQPSSAPPEIVTYRIDPDSGELTPANTLVQGRSVNAMAVPPQRNGVYVESKFQNDPAYLSAYAIDAASGALTLVAETQANGLLAAHPQGNYAFLADGSSSALGQVTVYKLDVEAGTLTPAGSPVPAGIRPVDIAVHPGGNFVYVSNRISHDVWSYRFDASTGALVPSGTPVSVGASAVSGTFDANANPIAFDPTGEFAYVGGDGGIHTYSIDPDTGALTEAGAPVPRSKLAMAIATASVVDSSSQ